jgi:hypothetical protein
MGSLAVVNPEPTAAIEACSATSSFQYPLPRRPKVAATDDFQPALSAFLAKPASASGESIA